MRRLLSVALLAFSTALAGSVLARGEAPAPEPVAQAPMPPIPPAVAAGFERTVKPFVAEFCYPCHGNKGEPKHGLNIEKFQSIESLIEHRTEWEDVAAMLRRAEMPPLEEEQPEEERRQAVATWLGQEFARIDRVTPPDPGRVTARRLNRTEYNNTIRELLGIDVRPADDFPQDDSGYGFDNIADVLSLSPVLMEKYVTTADQVSRLALFGPPPFDPTLIRLRAGGGRSGETRAFPDRYDETGLSLPNAFHGQHRIPVDGEYLVRVFLGGVRPANSEPVTLALWVDEHQVATLEHDPERYGRFEIDRQDFGGQTADFRVTLAAGERRLAVSILRIFEGLPPRLHGPNPSSKPDPPREFSPPPNAPPERIPLFRKRFEEAQATLAKLPLDGVRVSALEVGGPYTHVSGPAAASLAKVYTCGHLDGGHQPICVSRIMTDFAKRAFRRPVTARELEKYIALVHRAQEEEHSFEEGLAVGLQAILVSPDFLFRIERDQRLGRSASFHEISQHELATRLSYFLWASMPDEELRRAADQGTLRQPKVLTAQVQRMLRDPKSRALAEHFGGQWLQFRALESLTRDRERFPDFEDYLRQSMRRETELFIEHIIREDRSVLDFINGRYTFVNERLARHYGIPDVSGPSFRQVDLTGLPRGGVLTHASVLSVSSYATRTSPVMRGKWILDNLLDSPPPEPPADVPNLDEATIGTSASLREQLEEHRTNPTCASCHRRMDPLGFGLENFDAVGKWRTMDGNFPIDASGALPDGRTFTGPEELMGILDGDRDEFARALTSRLLTYALGRGLERYDARTIKEIASRLPAHEYRFSGLVLEIVNSLPFQSRRPFVEPQMQRTSK